MAPLLLLLAHRRRAARVPAAVRTCSMSALRWRCPACQENLQPSLVEPELRCAAGHSVLVAREGHVHLLAAGRRPRSKPDAPGDSDAMVRARRRLFELGGYPAQVGGVASAAVAALRRQTGVSLVQNVLDAGCGEGQYLRALADASGTCPIQLWGTDLSKLAVRYAAKRQQHGNFAVAKSTRLPFADSSLDLVLSVFAPTPWDEFSRVVRPGGAVVAVRGGPEHLQGLKQLLYRDRGTTTRLSRKETEVGGWQDRDGRIVDYCNSGSGLTLEDTTRVLTTDTFNGEAAACLLAMTPYYWRATAAQQQALNASNAEVRTKVDFVIDTLRLSGDQ
jgi:23S rRNA (guanine745-N1)-methyltransferase